MFVSLWMVATTSIVHAQEPYQRLARKLEISELGISSPAGVAYLPGANALLVAPSPGSTEMAVVTFILNRAENVALSSPLTNPVNMAFDGGFNSLLWLNPEAEELVEIAADGNGRPQSTPNALTRFDARAFGIREARGITVDPQTGDLFVLVVPNSAAAPRIVRIAPAQNRFRNPTVSTIPLTSLQGEALHGIAFNPTDGRLYVMAPVEQKLYTLTVEGQILSSRDFTSFELGAVQNMVFAPSSDQTDDPSVMNLYIAYSDQPDNGAGKKIDTGFTIQAVEQGSGDIAEVSLTQPDVLDLSDISTSATHIQTVLTSQFSPPSPDAAGLAYFAPAGNLLIVDSEVNEMPLFAGVNVWETTLTGSQVQEYDTTPFTDEPTGIAYNPNNQHLFFSDDTGTRAVYELDPGPDGLHYTADDIVTSFNTSDFSNPDPEGVAYDTHQGHLFIAGGADAEVYDVDPGPNGIFDGVPPAGDDIVNQFDTAILGLFDPEGVEFNPDNGTLFIVSQDDDVVVETTRDGTPVQVIDVSFLGGNNLAGITYAPSSTNPSEKSLYIVARGTDNNSDPNENDGVLYEVGLGSTVPSLLINDVTVIEGNTGTVNAVFTVTLTSPSQQTVTVNYSTSNGSATTADNDYNAASGQLTFLSGETSKQITIQVNGDSFEEGDETFSVDLSNATVVNIGDNQGIATIIGDDGPDPIVVSFKDGVNGYTGTRDAVLRFDTPTTNYGNDLAIALDGSPDEGGLVYWDVSSIQSGSLVESVDIVVNITNTSSGDYEIYESLRAWVEDEATWNVYASGQSWAVAGAGGAADRGNTALGAVTGSSTGPATISLNANGIAVVQSWIDNPSSNHGFVIQDYINHSNGLGFSSREAPQSERPELVVTLAGNSNPTLTIDDVNVIEGDAGTIDATFNVSLLPAATGTVTVDFATTDGTATGGIDYFSTSGQLTFLPGETSKPITVTVNGDTNEESAETFFVDLSNPIGANIGDAQGIATISDDDSSLPGTPITFSVSGDYPYDPSELADLQQDMDDHNLYSPSDFFFHVGDIFSGSESCFEQRYIDVANSLKTLAVPAFIVIGDNEWVDCSNPTQAFQWWENSFTNFEQNYCGAPVVDHQTVRNENWAFVSKGVLFIGVNIPNGNISSNEEAARLQENADWVDFHLVDKKDQVRAAIVFGHAGPSSDRDLFFNQFEGLLGHLR